MLRRRRQVVEENTTIMYEEKKPRVLYERINNIYCARGVSKITPDVVAAAAAAAARVERVRILGF